MEYVYFFTILVTINDHGKPPYPARTEYAWTVGLLLCLHVCVNFGHKNLQHLYKWYVFVDPPRQGNSNADTWDTSETFHPLKMILESSVLRYGTRYEYNCASGSIVSFRPYKNFQNIEVITKPRVLKYPYRPLYMLLNTYVYTTKAYYYNLRASSPLERKPL